MAHAAAPAIPAGASHRRDRRAGALRRRLNGESPEDARRRLALDLVALRRLGYAGAHISGLLTPSRITAVLDEADRLDASLGDDWRVVSQCERGAH